VNDLAVMLAIFAMAPSYFLLIMSLGPSHCE
jgi:hypothetical protein